MYWYLSERLDVTGPRPLCFSAVKLYIKVLDNIGLRFMKWEGLTLQNDSEILQELISFTFMSGRLSELVKQKLFSSADTQDSSLESLVC